MEELNLRTFKQIIYTCLEDIFETAALHQLLDSFTTFHWWQFFQMCVGNYRIGNYPGIVGILLRSLRAAFLPPADLELAARTFLFFEALKRIVSLVLAEIAKILHAPIPRGSFFPIPKTEIGGCARSDSLVRPLTF